MKLLFMRHGESKSQAQLVQNSDPDILNNLTSNGIQQVKDASKIFNGKLNAVYSSPYIRTKETAQIFLDTIKQPLSIITDERLCEIDYGFHGGDTKKHPEMIEVATKQIAGDYEIRFGRTGENKREIVTRFFNFMIDIFNKHDTDDTILAVTHGRAISIIEYEFCKINNIACELSGTKNAQIKEIILTDDRINKVEQHLQSINKVKNTII